MATKYWLMKSEPDVFSFDDLWNSPKKTDFWDGVRNYQARNFMRDEMKKGDEVLFYHSNCKEPGIYGLAQIAKEGYPDDTAFDPKSKYFDAKSDPANPRWYRVDVVAKAPLAAPVLLTHIKQHKVLQEMLVARKGQRLSIQPVVKKHFDLVLKLGK